MLAEQEDTPLLFPASWSARACSLSIALACGSRVVCLSRLDPPGCSGGPEGRRGCRRPIRLLCWLPDDPGGRKGQLAWWESFTLPQR